VQKKILIVEDDKSIASVLAIRLKAADYETTIAHEAVQAISLVRQHRPDLVLLDIMMPGGNGFLVAEWMQEAEETLSIPIIFISASQHSDLRETASEYGPVAFFEKPFEAKELLAVIQAVLSQTVATPLSSTR
jgi:two-component system phosphate regulon response regulator PhoB